MVIFKHKREISLIFLCNMSSGVGPARMGEIRSKTVFVFGKKARWRFK